MPCYPKGKCFRSHSYQLKGGCLLVMASSKGGKGKGMMMSEKDMKEHAGGMSPKMGKMGDMPKQGGKGMKSYPEPSRGGKNPKKGKKR